MYFSNSIEDLCIKKIEAGIRGLKFGTKKPSELDLTNSFKRLESLNTGQYQDLMTKYETAVRQYKNKFEKTY